MYLITIRQGSMVRGRTRPIRHITGHRPAISAPASSPPGSPSVLAMRSAAGLAAIGMATSIGAVAAITSPLIRPETGPETGRVQAAHPIPLAAQATLGGRGSIIGKVPAIGADVRHSANFAAG